ncbi:MAG: ATP-binding protein [Alphaproteobacteria bacterium]|nr:ATP-binding protein [Alphaproteobacteria bacterium]MBO6862548.1 ATP-binding protein [Alphaproteobacteria bacterium]
MSSADMLWVITAACLVFLMQLGFCALEAGLVRSRNSINVVAKNFVDLCIAGFAFWLIGAHLMFADGAIAVRGAAGDANLTVAQGWGVTVLIFQIMFCGTATTIISGAVAERMRFSSYALVVTLVAAFVYPVFGGWAWQGIDGGAPGWLEARGFHDFAGSTVVHSIGGWVALALLFIIGPRLGRFGPDGRKPQSSNMPMAGLGVMLMWLGWMGFNGGSTLAFEARVAPILLNTLIAGFSGGLCALVVAIVSRRPTRIDMLLFGALGGLVAVTAGADVYGEHAAAIVGVIGAAAVYLGNAVLEKMRIDDAVGAVPVHLFAGIAGTLAVPFFAEAGTMSHPLMQQIAVQVLGIGSIGAATFIVSYAVLFIVNRVVPFRVSAEAEHLGLNVVEHSETTPIADLVEDMQAHQATGDITQDVRVELGSEVEPIAAQYNRVVARLRDDSERLQRAFAQLNEAKAGAESANRSKSAFLANMSHELRTPLNAIIGFSEIMCAETFGPLGSDTRYKEYAVTIREAGSHLLSLVNDLLEHSRIEAGKQELRESKIDVGTLLNSVIRFTHDTAATKQVRLHLEEVEGLPYLIADERLLRQILLNLISNAIKFTGPDGAVTVSAQVDDTMRVEISVTDNGIGMSEDEIDLALQPFTQIDNAYSKSHAGTGLGLPLAKSMMRIHGGHLAIRSEKGVGTTVTIRFPESRSSR